MERWWWWWLYLVVGVESKYMYSMSWFTIGTQGSMVPGR